ncbi:hypothetical protein BLA60_31125 [Actinophytocola xinjiangensis]|uniref:Uncharacterized protein n=1 Tax=Actinophytocola xinjiangensis TaxID=485602 RepID=A0A7Z1AWN0_9PSEU|nr:hypothetical protein [Actinophytocola xinjiangensis]OLF06710.1 hypothetical protein BLA60_31125 [Actinophytocola xinjiangensis]
MDLQAAASFLATHGRQLDRRRFEYLLAGPGADPGPVLAAVDAYRNADGGYGWGLEPDLRAPESQPGGALHALEVFAEAGPTPRSVEVCDWLGRVALPDGGMPFALPVADPTGCAPFWVDADPGVSSLQSTAFVAGVAHQVAARDPAVAAHPWLAAATRYCLDAVAALDARPHAIELSFAIGFLDAVHDTHPEADALLDRLAAFVPPDGLVPVDGGSDGETMRPLDFAPLPDRPARRLFTPEVIAADLARVAGGQQDDGGWRVDFASFSPAAEMEWRGYATVGAMNMLTANGIR